MVKERKPQTGSTNLDSSRYYELPITSQDSLTRSVTHKIIVPDPPVPLPYEARRRIREVPQVATWKAGNPLKKDFKTTHETSYTDPASRIDEPGFESSFSSLKAEEMRHLAQNSAIDKLNRVAKHRFGSCSNLFKAVCISHFCLQFDASIIFFNVYHTVQKIHWRFNFSART